MAIRDADPSCGGQHGDAMTAIRPSSDGWRHRVGAFAHECGNGASPGAPMPRGSAAGAGQLRELNSERLWQWRCTRHQLGVQR